MLKEPQHPWELTVQCWNQQASSSASALGQVWGFSKRRGSGIDFMQSCVPSLCQFRISFVCFCEASWELHSLIRRHGPCPARALKLGGKKNRNRDGTAKAGCPQSKQWNHILNPHQRCLVRLAGTLRHGRLLLCKNWNRCLTIFLQMLIPHPPPNHSLPELGERKIIVSTDSLPLPQRMPINPLQETEKCRVTCPPEGNVSRWLKSHEFLRRGQGRGSGLAYQKLQNVIVWSREFQVKQTHVYTGARYVISPSSGVSSSHHHYLNERMMVEYFEFNNESKMLSTVTGTRLICKLFIHLLSI